jgi:hypothetical protein
MSNFQPSKPINFSPIKITTNFSLVAETYNVVYAAIAAPSTLTLPSLTGVIDGCPVIVLNTGSATLTVNLSNNTLFASVLAGQLLIFLADKQAVPSTWDIILGPSSSTQLVAGPTTTTVGDIATWNNTTGTLLKDSSVNISGGGAITGAASITLATTGGTPTALNYYEEVALTGNTFTGAFSVAQACVPQITRVGRDVTLLMPSVSAAAAAAVATSTVAIPARFLPAAGNTGGFGYLTQAMIAQQSATTATNGQTAGQVTVNATTGIIVIGVTSATGPAAFTGTNNNGWPEFAMRWSV